VHAETERTVYGGTTFYFADMEGFEAWMSRRGGLQLGWIRRISVGWSWWTEYKRAWNDGPGLKSRLPGLLTLEVTGWMTFAVGDRPERGVTTSATTSPSFDSSGARRVGGEQGAYAAEREMGLGGRSKARRKKRQAWKDRVVGVRKRVLSSQHRVAEGVDEPLGDPV